MQVTISEETRDATINIPFLDVAAELAKLEQSKTDLGAFLINNRDEESRIPIANHIVCQWLSSHRDEPSVVLSGITREQALSLSPPFDLYLSSDTKDVIPRRMNFDDPTASDPVIEALGNLWTQANPIQTAQVIQACLRLAESDRLWKQFPGTHPVHLTRANASNISRYPYVISKKIDGTRYMLYISNGVMWLSDRKLQVPVRVL